MSTVIQKETLTGGIRQTSQPLKGSTNPKHRLGGVVFGASGGGVSDYEALINLPKINSVTLKGNKTFDELGLEEATNLDIDKLF